MLPGKGDMVADDRARAFQDPNLLWWDETAQLLRRVRALRSTNAMSRQLRAGYEALRRRISTLPPFLESDPSFEFEERPNWCNALHAVDEIEDQELDNLIACALFHDVLSTCCFVYTMIEQSCVLDVVHCTTFHRHVAHQAGPLCALKRNPHDRHSHLNMDIWCFW